MCTHPHLPWQTNLDEAPSVFNGLQLVYFLIPPNRRSIDFLSTCRPALSRFFAN